MHGGGRALDGRGQRVDAAEQQGGATLATAPQLLFAKIYSTEYMIKS